MAGGLAPAERPPDDGSTESGTSPADPADGFQLLRLPGGDPRPREPLPAVSVRRTVGLPERRGPRGLVGKLVRAGAWTVSASVIAGGSFALYQMLFAGGEFDLPLNSQTPAAVSTAGGLRSGDPDLPLKTDLLAPLLAPRAIVETPPPPAVVTIGSTDQAGTGPGPGIDSSDQGSGGTSGDDGDGDSSGQGSGDDGDGDSSGHGSGTTATATPPVTAPATATATPPVTAPAATEPFPARPGRR